MYGLGGVADGMTATTVVSTSTEIDTITLPPSTVISTSTQQETTTDVITTSLPGESEPSA